MKNKTKHTPLPWETGALMSTVTAPRINAPVPIFVADCGTKNAPSSEAERCANAAFIVQVCNSHEDLLQSLKHVITAAEIIDGQDSPPADDVSHLHTTIEIARAAIAKAEGREG